MLGYESAAVSAGGGFAATAIADESPLEIQLSTAVHPILSREYSTFLQAITAGFEEVGVTIQPEPITMPKLLEAVAEASVDLALARWVADYPDADAFAYLLHSQEGWLGGMCGSPEIDRLIERGRTETDIRTRHSIYQEIERIIAREALLIPLFHEQVYRFARPEVSGMRVSFTYPVVAYEELTIDGP